MVVAIETLNNIITHMILITYCGVLSNHYGYQTTNNFKKLLKQKDAENKSKMATTILLAISMHIRLTRLLEVSSFHAEYDLERRLRERCTGADWGDKSEIEETMTAGNNKDDDDEDP